MPGPFLYIGGALPPLLPARFMQALCWRLSPATWLQKHTRVCGLYAWKIWIRHAKVPRLQLPFSIHLKHWVCIGMAQFYIKANARLRIWQHWQSLIVNN